MGAKLALEPADTALGADVIDDLSDGLDDDDDDDDVEVVVTGDARAAVSSSGASRARAFAARWRANRRNRALLDAFVAKTTIDWIAPRRPGAPLLVLDLDHTLVDFDQSSSHAVAPRPHLHRFLEETSRTYDLAIWSQTSWRWLELKLTELGLLGGESSRYYRIVFVLDKHSMLCVASKHRASGRDVRHRVKPLEIIWRKCPDVYSSANTVHVDDLSRNFVLNPGSGIKCKPYHRDVDRRERRRRRRRHRDHDDDDPAVPPSQWDDLELPLLAVYLTRVVATRSNFAAVDHSTWRTQAIALYEQQQHSGLLLATASSTSPAPSHYVGGGNNNNNPPSATIVIDADDAPASLTAAGTSTTTTSGAPPPAVDDDDASSSGGTDDLQRGGSADAP